LAERSRNDPQDGRPAFRFRVEKPYLGRLQPADILLLEKLTCLFHFKTQSRGVDLKQLIVSAQPR
jgi:hypothetical protein